MMEMSLDDPRMIQQAYDMSISEMEPLYWKVEDTFHKGDKKQAQNIFAILLYTAKFNPKLVSLGLKPGHRRRLRILSYELFEEFVPQNDKSAGIRQPIGSITLPFVRELDLQEYLQSHPEVLSEALGDAVQIVGIEVDVGDDYRCDIVAEGELFYPIELKIGQTTHAVVSQCKKYCYYFYRKLRYNFYKEIQGVVVGNGFDSWSINELRREGIWCFTVKPVNKSDICLVKVD